MTAAPLAPPGGLRLDVQALRAFAVVAVLVYHLFPQRLTGGFIGVDTFFVISGFLITGHLLREARETGGIRLWRFWSRRARRLLPAALTVLTLTAFAIYLLVPPNLWSQYFTEIITATLYVLNWLLASNSVDYLAAENTASPVQHFWTLSVEEQFYIAVPLLMLALLVVAGRARIDVRRTLFAGLLVLTGASLAYSVWLTAVSQPTAYFVTPARAWEFGIGALLSFGWRANSRAVGVTAVLGGLAAVGAATFLLAADVSFPGWIAAWPVLATAAILWGGPAAGPRLDAVFAWAPLQFLGRISYSLYLWHWPLIVLLPFLTGHALTLLDKVLLAALSVLLAWASTVFIEDPFRFSPRVNSAARTAPLVAAWSAAGMAVVVAVAAGGLVLTEQAATTAAERRRVLSQQHAVCLGARTVTNPTCTEDTPLGKELIPDPAHVTRDDSNRKECWTREDETTLRMCTLGDPDARVRIAALGDSHNNALLSAYSRIAEQRGWRIDLAGQRGCPWSGTVLVKPTQALTDACEGWKRNVRAHLRAQPAYDAIVVTEARRQGTVATPPGIDAMDTAVAGLVSEWAPQAKRGTTIIAIRDNPRMKPDVVTCVARHGVAANGHCSRPESQALGGRDPQVEAVAKSPGARLIDLSSLYCPDGRCVPLIGSVVVYRDPHHLTGTFASTLDSVLGDRLEKALGGEASHRAPVNARVGNGPGSPPS